MSELRKMTRMGGDLRKIARLLQDKGRNGDTILAHINPREAALLREQGGSGTVNPETGLPEFYTDDYGNPIPETGYENVPEGLFEGAAYIPDSTGYESVSQMPFEWPRSVLPATGYDALRGPIGPELDITAPATRSFAAQPQQQTFEANYFPESTFQDMAGFRPAFADNAPTSLGLAQGIYGQDTTPFSTPTSLGLTRGAYGQDATGLLEKGGLPEKGFLDSLTGGDKLRLGLGALGGLQTALTARKARQGSQDAARRISEIGRPYQQQGLAQQSAASRGELTPVNQQALDAMRARASQAGVARGGVGVAQQQRAEEDLRQRLLAAQQDFGLKLSGIGDQYTAKAITEGIRADAEIASLYGQYFGNLTRLAAPSVIQANQPVGK